MLTIVRVPAAANGRLDAGIRQAFGVAHGEILGEFNRSLQQLSKEKLQWVLRDDVGLIARAEARSALQVVRRRDAVNTDNGSGGPSRVGCRVGMPHARVRGVHLKLASRNRSAPGGSERMPACRHPI
jgi:hypothetical protein